MTISIKFIEGRGFHLVDTSDPLLANNFIVGSGFQPLLVANFGYTPPAVSYSFLPYIIVTDNFV